MQVSALITGLVIAILTSLVARRETTATLIVAGLLTECTVAATILVTVVVGPATSGDHTDLGLVVIGPLLLGGVLAFGLLTMVTRYRRRNLPSDTSAAGSAR